MLDGPLRNNFSIRQMLLVVFFFALFSFLAAAAYAGDPMAYGLVLAAFGLIVPICCIVITSGVANFTAQCKLGWSRKIEGECDGDKKLPSESHDSACENNSGMNDAHLTGGSEAKK